MVLKIRWPNCVFVSLSFKSCLGFFFQSDIYICVCVYIYMIQLTLLDLPSFPDLFQIPSSSHLRVPGSPRP